MRPGVHGAGSQDIDVVLRGMPARALTIRTWRSPAGTCASSVNMTIAGVPARVANVYVQQTLFGVAYVLLTGEHPFQGRNSLAAHRARQAPRRPDGISAGQWRALKAGLSFDPKYRPADMKAWLDRFGLPPVPLILPSLVTIMSERRPRPKRAGPPVVTALIALAAGVCWWTQDQYGWLKDSGATTAISTTEAALQSAMGTTPSAARPLPAVPMHSPPLASPPVQVQSLPAHEPPAQTSPPGAVGATEPAVTAYRERARIELATNTLEVPQMQPVARVPVSRRDNYQREVSFTWSTESGTAKPGQDFMPVYSRTEYISAGAPLTQLLVPIVQNPRRHLPRTFYVVVDTPGAGATLGMRTITQVTIPASD